MQTIVRLTTFCTVLIRQLGVLHMILKINYDTPNAFCTTINLKCKSRKRKRKKRITKIEKWSGLITLMQMLPLM